MRTLQPAWICLLGLAACAHPQKMEPSSVDPHQYLEDSKDPETQRWVKRETRLATDELEGDWRFSKLRAEAAAILNSEARLAEGSILGGHIYNLWQSEAHPRGLWRRSPVEAYRAGKPSWEVLLDLDKLSQVDGRSLGLADADCLGPEYARCLVQLSVGGGDQTILRELRVGSNIAPPEAFTLPAQKQEARYLNADELLIAAALKPAELTRSGYPRLVRRWKRGSPLSSAPVLLVIEPDEVGLSPHVFSDGGQRYAFIQRSERYFKQRHYWLRPDGTLKELPLPGRCELWGVTKGQLIVSLGEPWSFGGDSYQSGDLIALELSELKASWVYSPGQSEALQQVEVAGERLYLVTLNKVAGHLQRLTHTDAGWEAEPVTLPEHGTVTVVSGDARGAALVSFESLTVPDTLYWVDAQGPAAQLAQLPAMYDASDVRVEQRFAASKDGTRVPYFVMGRKSALAAGPSPTLVYGYGGFNVPILPRYLTHPGRPQDGALIGKLWVERGGLLAIANIRGGGEFGPAWHEAAMKEKRERAFEDFIAVAEDLIHRGETSPEQLGALGRSNGGLLMGVMLTRRPRLFAALDIGVPLLDMLRYDQLSAGASWIDEYGDPSVPEERAALAAYSPYAQLHQGASYPRVLLFTSAADDRVHPGHARKMAAKLKELGRRPLFIEDTEGGHAGDTSAQMARRIARELTYFMRQLKLDAHR